METGTTPELITLSEKFEYENLSFTPPPKSCTSCNTYGNLGTADWVPGHRPGWWICKQCETVLPCRCEVPDETGHCRECGRKMRSNAVRLYKLEENKKACEAEIHELKTMFLDLPTPSLLGKDGFKEAWD